MQSFTTQTKLNSEDKNSINFLEAMAAKFGAVERSAFNAINKGRVIDKAFENELQQNNGLSSQDVRNIITKAEANYKSQKELVNLYIEQTKDSLNSIKSAIKKFEDKIKLLREQGKKKPDKLKFIPSLELKIHHKKRKLARKTARLAELEATKKSGNFSVTFGSKELFKAQFNLHENGYRNHEEWLKDWQAARSNHIFYVGSNRFGSGNLLCRLTETGELTITVPPSLREPLRVRQSPLSGDPPSPKGRRQGRTALDSQFGTHITFNGVTFRYGQEYINAALTPKRFENTNKKTGEVTYRTGTTAPLTHLIIKKGEQWYLHTTVELPEVPYQSHRINGVLGIDLNPNSVDWSVCDAQGNLKDKGNIKLNIQDKSTNATKDTIGKVCAELVRIAENFGVPISIEKLDFAKKKASLGEKSKRYARMLSNFAYSTFAQMLLARCQKFGIELIKVEPAYSSVQGLTKFMAMYGLNSGSAAALVLARRALRKSERLPRALHVALKKPADNFRHVWKAWSVVAKVLNTRGSRNRHVFFTQKSGANSLTQVTLTGLSLNRKVKALGSKQGASHLRVRSATPGAPG